MITRDWQLLLYCARSQLDPERIRDLVRAGPDWQTLLELAKQHGVRPLLRKALKLVCWDAVPQGSQLELEGSIRANLQRNLSLTGELLRLVEVFEEKDIPIIAFKGPVLAETVYGDLSLREFSDLDVMVQKAHLNEAEDLLIASGYRPQFPDRTYRSTFVGYHGQYAFSHVESDICVDLHWQLLCKALPFRIDSSEVWTKLRQVTIANRTVLTLAEDDLILFLAAHGTKEGWRRLLWLADFAELLRKCGQIDWARLLSRARQTRTLRSLLLAIDLASTLLDAPAPASLVDRARAKSAAQSEKARLRMISNASPGAFGQFLDSLSAHDKLRYGLLPLASLLTTRTVGDHNAMPLPESLWGIYYLTRPFRLVVKVLKMMAKN